MTIICDFSIFSSTFISVILIEFIVCLLQFHIHWCLVLLAISSLSMSPMMIMLWSSLSFTLILLFCHLCAHTLLKSYSLLFRIQLKANVNAFLLGSFLSFFPPSFPFFLLPLYYVFRVLWHLFPSFLSFFLNLGSIISLWRSRLYGRGKENQTEHQITLNSSPQLQHVQLKLGKAPHLCQL